MIDYGYGTNNNPTRTSPLDILNLIFPGNANVNTTFKDACVDRARAIIHYFPGIEFSLSGGIWSHISYMSFVEAGYKPPVKIIQLPREINQLDMEAAQSLAKYAGSDVEIINAPLKDEILDSYIDIAKKYQTYNFSDALMARFSELNGNNIFIADHITIKRNIEPGWRFVVDEGSDFYWHRFNYANKHKIIKSFFTGSADIIYQFFNLPTVKNIVSDGIPHKLTTNTSLKQIFEEAGWDLPERLSLRYTYSDALPEFSRLMNRRITQKTGFKKRYITIPYDKLLKSLTGESYRCSFV